MDTHRYLKTRLVLQQGEVMQQRRDEQPAEILVLNGDESKMKSVMTEFVQPFDLFNDNLYRFEIYTTQSSVYPLMDFHHIAFDGASMGVFLQDLKQVLEGKELLAESVSPRCVPLRKGSPAITRIPAGRGIFQRPDRRRVHHVRNSAFAQSIGRKRCREYRETVSERSLTHFAGITA